MRWFLIVMIAVHFFRAIVPSVQLMFGEHPYALVRTKNMDLLEALYCFFVIAYAVTIF